MNRQRLVCEEETSDQSDSKQPTQHLENLENSEKVDVSSDRQLRKIWICTDVLMDILPFFGHAQLGLKLALISPRFDALVDTHFDGKAEWTIWRRYAIRKDIGMPKMIASHFVEFPLPNHPLPNKIRFNSLWIQYIDHSVLVFLRANQQIWDKGTKLHLEIYPSQNNNVRPFWNAFVREILPIVAPNIRHLQFPDGAQLHKLLQHVSPTILIDLNRLNSINSGDLLSELLDGSNSTAGQALFKWLHTPTTDGQTKQLFFQDFSEKGSSVWVNDFKEKFPRATTSASYEILFVACLMPTPIVPFELKNERTKEKLILIKSIGWSNRWIMKRCPIGETAAIQWEDKNWDDLSTVEFKIFGNNCIGRLTPQRKGCHIM